MLLPDYSLIFAIVEWRLFPYHFSRRGRSRPVANITDWHLHLSRCRAIRAPNWCSIYFPGERHCIWPCRRQSRPGPCVLLSTVGLTKSCKHNKSAKRLYRRHRIKRYHGHCGPFRWLGDTDDRGNLWRLSVHLYSSNHGSFSHLIFERRRKFLTLEDALATSDCHTATQSGGRLSVLALIILEFFSNRP